MTEPENQSSLDKDSLTGDLVSNQQTTLLSKTKKNWLGYQLFWRRRALLPAIKADILPAKRLNRWPAVLLGVLFVLSLLSTDLLYWDSAVRVGTKIVAMTTNTIGVTYAYMTKPLDYTLDKAAYLIKGVEQKNLAAVTANWGELVKRGYSQVIKTLAIGENQIADKLEQASRDSSLALIQKSNSWATNINGVKEKVAVRRQLLGARALVVLDKVVGVDSGFFASVKRGVSQVSKEVKALPPQVAATWNSASMINLGRMENTLRQIYERWSIRLIKWAIFLDNGLLWFENLPVRLNQKISAIWTATLLKADEVALNWRNFINPSEVSPEAMAEIKKVIAEEISKNLRLQSQSGQVDDDTMRASYGAVVVPSTGDPSADEKIKKDLEKQFSDEVSISFDKSGQAGVITPIFEDGEKGDDYVFLLTPFNQ